jgi:hypothetical protein
MCWRCDEIGKKIEHYRKLATRITDERSLKGVELLIARLNETKEGLHPEGPDDLPSACDE